MHQKYPKVLVAKMGLLVLFDLSFIMASELAVVCIMARPFLFCRWCRPENEYFMHFFAIWNLIHLIGKTIRHSVFCGQQWNNGTFFNWKVQTIPLCGISGSGPQASGPLLATFKYFPHNLLNS